jgi:UPF0716 protein FxsA
VIGPALFLAFTVVPIVETWLLIEVGGRVGAMETVAYIIGIGVLGAWLGKRAGFSVLRELQSELAAGRPPTDKLVEGVLVVVGSVLMIAPGVLTDVTGTLLFVAPLRRWMAPRLRAYVGRRVQVQAFPFGGRGASGPAPEPPRESPPPAAPQRGRVFGHPRPRGDD